MKKIQTFIYVLLMGVCFAACQEDDFGGSAQGGIRIALADGTAGVDVTTRSTPSELFAGFKEKFKFQIKGDNYDQTHNWTDDVIPLAAGVYDITATCGTEQADGEVGFDEPCYKGTKEGQRVNVGETATEVSIPCEVTNALVSIKFGDEYKEFAEKAYAQISVRQGDAEGRRWDPLTTSAYFKAGSSLTKLKIYKDDDDSLGADILTDAQKDADFPKTFKAGDHLIITLSVAKKDGNVAIKVSRVELKDVTIKETIPMEWLPKPKVEADGFDGNALTFVETETPEAKLNLNLASALQDIKFKFDFEDEQFSSLTKEEYVWSNEEDKKVISEQLGINVSDNNVDLNGLLAKLQTNAGAATTNTIEVDVKANDRWSSEDKEANRKYTITCNKPVFRVDAYPGNIWTKEFTLNALREEQVESGDFAKISGNIKYQYSTDGENNWTDLSDDLRKDQLEPGTTYYIRGLYRDAVPGEVAEVKTYPAIALENGDMEDWAYTDGPEASWPSKGPFWKRWYVRTNKDESTDGWCSLNYYTTSNNDPKAYCSNSGTEQSSDKHTGNYAAEIKTIGWGNGTTAASPISTIKENTPGELFLGKITNNEREYGISYESRPTNLVFWYKYQPEGSHEFTAKIVIENKNENIILAEEIFNGNKQDSYVEKNISINYKEEYKHIAPTHMYVLFSSGENTNSEVDKASITRGSRHVGNILYIDDISLVYDK